MAVSSDFLHVNTILDFLNLQAGWMVMTGGLHMAPGRQLCNHSSVQLLLMAAADCVREIRLSVFNG